MSDPIEEMIEAGVAEVLKLETVEALARGEQAEADAARLRDTVAALANRIAALRAALRPFAAWAQKRDERRCRAFMQPLPDSKPLVDADVTWIDVPTMGDCRKAAQVLGDES